MHLLVGYTVASYSGDPQDPLDRNTSCTVALTAMVEFLESSPPDRHHGGVLPVCILSRGSSMFKGAPYRDVPPH
jgi:hypothetical protein